MTKKTIIPFVLIMILASPFYCEGGEQKEKIYRERNVFFRQILQKIGTHPLDYKGLKFTEIAQRYAEQHGAPDSFDCDLGFMCVLKYYVRYNKMNFDVYVYFTQSRKRYVNEYGGVYYSETYTVKVKDPITHKELIKEHINF